MRLRHNHTTLSSLATLSTRSWSSLFILRSRLTDVAFTRSLANSALMLTLARFQAWARVPLVFAGAEAAPEDGASRRLGRRWRPWRSRPSRSRPRPSAIPSRLAWQTCPGGRPRSRPRRCLRRPRRTWDLRGRSRRRAARRPACRRWGRRRWDCRRSRGR